LPDREAETLADWLRKHPSVLIVSRDRGGNYAEGVRKGAPGAIQIADRFHLLKNLGDAVADLLTRHLLAARRKPPANVSPEGNQQKKAGPPIKEPLKVPPPLAAAREAREEERLARYEQVIALRDQGLSHQAIADHLGIGHTTVQRWLKEGHFPQRKAREQSSQLDRFLPYIQRKRTQGCYNMAQLHLELQERGYQGSYAGMRHILLRVFPKEQKWQRTPASKEENTVLPPSTREATRLFLRPPDQLTQKERERLEQVCQIHEEVALAYQLVQQFALMLRTRQGGQLDAWLEKVAQSPLQDLHSFAKGIKSDIEAVEAGLILPWSNGQTEGQITRLKLLKRLGYGRAHFQTLRKRVLYQAS
jgi:transposase